MQTYNRPNSIPKACKPSVVQSTAPKAKRQVSVLWLATSSRKAFTETLRG